MTRRIELDDAADSGAHQPCGTLRRPAPGAVRRWRFLALTRSCNPRCDALVPLRSRPVHAVAQALAPSTRRSYRFSSVGGRTCRARILPRGLRTGSQSSTWPKSIGVRQVFTRSLDSAISTQITKSCDGCLWLRSGLRMALASTSPLSPRSEETCGRSVRPVESHSLS